MSNIKVLVRTQRIVVDPATSSVSVINAGPIGPTGATGGTDVPAILTSDGQLLTRTAGVPAAITRANLAADSAFTSRYLELSDFTADDQIMTRSAGVVAPISRATLAGDAAFTTRFQSTTVSSSLPSGTPANGSTWYHTTSKREFRFDGTNWLLVAGDMPRCKLGRTAVQSIAATTITKMLWTNETYDTDNLHSTSTNTSRITLSHSGIWTFSYVIGMAAAALGHRECWLIKNNTGDRHADNRMQQSSDFRFNGSVDIACAAGDYVELEVYSNQAIDVWTSATVDYLQCIYRGPGS